MSFYTSPDLNVVEKHESTRGPPRRPKHPSFLRRMGQRFSFSFFKKRKKCQTLKDVPESPVPQLRPESNVASTPVDLSTPDVTVPGASGPSTRASVPARPPFPTAFQGELTNKLRARMSSNHATDASSPLTEKSAVDVTPNADAESSSSAQYTSPDLAGMQHKLAVGRQRNRRPPTRKDPNKSRESMEVTGDLDDGCVTFFSSPSTTSTPFTSPLLESINEEEINAQVPPDLTAATAPATPLTSQTSAPTKPPTPEVKRTVERLSLGAQETGKPKELSLTFEPKLIKTPSGLSPNVQHVKAIQEIFRDLDFPETSEDSLPRRASFLDNDETNGASGQEQNGTPIRHTAAAGDQRGRLRSLSSPEREDSLNEDLPPLKRLSKRPVSMFDAPPTGQSSPAKVHHSPPVHKQVTADEEEATTATVVPRVRSSPHGGRHSMPSSALKPVNGSSIDTSEDLGSVSARASVFGAQLHSPKSDVELPRVRPKSKEPSTCGSEASPGTGKRASRVFDLVKNFENAP